MLLACTLLFSCNGSDDSGDQGSETSDQVPVYTPDIINTYNHDQGAWTQGLFYSNGFLYESTGLEGKSSLRKVEIETGEVTQKTDLASEYFAEGITLFEDKIIQLTWQNKTCFVYDKESFQLLSEFDYPTNWPEEGWGITYDGEYLIMSDGTDVLYYLDPDDYSVVEEINVTADGEAVTYLNELEHINGNIYANIWQTDRIAVIQPDGEVIAWIDLEGILSSADCSSEIDVLNGIAYNPDSDTIYVTGKYWCRLFELEFVP